MSERLEPYVAYLRVERRRGALTIARYRSILDGFLAHLSADAAPCPSAEEVTKHHCISFLRSPGTATEEPSASVWNQRRAALRSFFGYLTDQEVIVKDPTRGIHYQRVNPREPEPLSLDEFIDLLDAAEASAPPYRTRNVAIVQVLFHTALRVAELVSLDIEQVDWSAYRFRNVRTKGEKWLHAPFNDMVAGALERLLAARATGPTDSALFLSKRRRRISERAVEVLVKGLAKRAGIQRDVTPHILRHSVVSEMVREGQPLSVPQRLCNHASQRTTEKYSHVRPDEVKAAVDAVGATVEKRIRARRRENAAA